MCFSTRPSTLVIAKSTLPKCSAFDIAPTGALLIAALMIELTQSKMGGTRMNMFTFEFEMVITLRMAVSHSFCEKCQFFRPSVDEYVGDAYRNQIQLLYSCHLRGPGRHLGSVEWPNNVDRSTLKNFPKVGDGDFQFGRRHHD